MFTGIIETVGLIERIESEGTNKHFLLSSAISNELKADQSVSHNGVCLTVTKQENGTHWVTAVQETLQKSNLGALQPGSLVYVSLNNVTRWVWSNPFAIIMEAGYLNSITIHQTKILPLRKAP